MATARSRRIDFGDFVADLTSGELFKEGGAKVQLQDKPFQILALLIQRPKELVTRQEIISKVWPDTFVEGDLCLNVAITRLRTALSDRASNPTFIETVGSHGYRFITDIKRSGAPEMVAPNGDRPRVAIFPFEIDADLHCDSFASGMTELIIVELRRLHPSLSVVTPEFTTGRTSKGKAKGKLSLCREVSADYMLVGTLSGADGQIRIILKLLKCRAQTCVWAESYTHSTVDLFAAQVAVGRKIATAIVQSIPASIRPSNLELATPAAYEDYLQGCSLRSKLSEDSLDRCIPLFEAAVRECPRFALAWGALANVHCMVARLGTAPSVKAFPKVKSCVAKALAIEDLIEARTALAYYQFFYEHEWEAAETSLLRALAMDARYPLAVSGYAQLLAALGRHEEAVFLMRQACELNPFAGYTAITFGWALYYAGNYEASLAQLKKALELEPSLWIGHTSAGMALERLGQMDAAVAEFRLAVEYSDNSSLARAHLAYGLARMGDKAGATEILDALLQLRQSHYFSPYWIAIIYVGLDEPSKALNWLETARKERCSWIVFAREDPKFAVLRSDPRFHRVVSGINPARRVICPS
jgi:DNA-binding winged helix-turn-helix (wHTH) protein/tetratricopeptide (TPR) repeat protein